MPADASIYGMIRPVQPANQLEQLAQVMQIQGLQRQGELGQYTLKKAQRSDDETNALAQAIRGGLDLSTQEGQRQAYSVAPTIAPSYIKTNLDAQKTRAEVSKAQTEATTKAVEAHRAALPNDPQGAALWLQAAYQNPDLKPLTSTLPLEQAISNIPTDPAGFQNWRNQMALGMTKYVELNKPTTNVVNAGGAEQIYQTPGLGGTPSLVQSVQKTVSPDAVLQAKTSRDNNAATIKKDLQVAGMAPGGGLDENSERTAQAIASGQLPAPTGMALLNPKNQRILGRVMEINPQYDSTTVDAKKKAARDFSTGQQGNAMRSFAVAGDHLDQLNQLVDALDNGNLQIVNKIGNAYATQTGSPAPTNFDAAKDVVSKEVVKAIVAGGGGVEERRELAHLMDQAKSPAQLKGVIQQYRNLMAAQHDALLQQRRAAGLSDSTLPNYSGVHGVQPAAPAAPSGWTYIGTTK